MSLVAYDSSSNSSTTSEENANESLSSKKKSENDEHSNLTFQLPSANQLFCDDKNKQKTSEIFGNPFLEAENAKIALLEKHVKMVIPNNDEIGQTTKKKICWNNQKGYCRFGSKCYYSHDTEFIKSNEQTKHVHLDNKLHDTPLTQPRKDESSRKRHGFSNYLQSSKRINVKYTEETPLMKNP